MLPMRNDEIKANIAVRQELRQGANAQDQLTEFLTSGSAPERIKSKKKFFEWFTDQITTRLSKTLIQKLTINDGQKTSKKVSVIWTFYDFDSSKDSSIDDIHNHVFNVSTLIINSKDPWGYHKVSEKIKISRHCLERMILRTGKEELADALKEIGDIITFLATHGKELYGHGDESFYILNKCCLVVIGLDKDCGMILKTFLPVEELNKEKLRAFVVYRIVANEYKPPIAGDDPVVAVSVDGFNNVMEGGCVRPGDFMIQRWYYRTE